MRGRWWRWPDLSGATAEAQCQTTHHHQHASKREESRLWLQQVASRRVLPISTRVCCWKVLESWSDLSAVCQATGQEDPTHVHTELPIPICFLIFLIFNYKMIQTYKYKNNMIPNSSGKIKQKWTYHFIYFISFYFEKWTDELIKKKNTINVSEVLSPSLQMDMTMTLMDITPFLHFY